MILEVVAEAEAEAAVASRATEAELTLEKRLETL
jgi:hypothetical protein